MWLDVATSLISCFKEIPLSAELLLGKFQRLPDGTHIVGGKEIKSYGIDAETGKVRQQNKLNVILMELGLTYECQLLN